MARAQTSPRGRDAELSALRAACDDTASGGRLIVVRGSAGIGKSALLDAAASAARAAGARVITAGRGAEKDRVEDPADEFGIGAIITAIRADFEQWADFQVADSINAIARIRRCFHENPEWWLPRLATELDGLFGHLTRRRRTVLVVDDAHTIAEPGLALATARRSGCLVVVACRDDLEPTSGTNELLALAHQVIELGPLPAEQIEALLTHRAGSALDQAVLPALRAALGPLYHNPGIALATIGDLRERGRLVVARDRLCLRDPAEPIALPAGNERFDRVQRLGELGRILFASVATLGELGMDDLPLLVRAIGTTGLTSLLSRGGDDGEVFGCGSLIDRMVELGVLVADQRGTVRCCCPALGAYAIEQFDALAPALHAALATALLGLREAGTPVDAAALADHLAAAGPVDTGRREDVTLLLAQAEAGCADEPRRAARWYAAALRWLAEDEPEHSRVLGVLLRLLVRTGYYELLYQLLVEHYTEGAPAPAVRADLCAAAMLASVHTGWALPEPVLATLVAGQGPVDGDPLGFSRSWFGHDADLVETGEHAAPEHQPLLSGAELELVRRAMAGDPDGCRRAWRELHGPSQVAGVDRLVAAGLLADLATVLEIVLGPRYQAPATGVLAVYQRVARGYADAEWSTAMSAIRELELTGEPDTLVHRMGRLFAAEICSARGDFRRAQEWLVDLVPDRRLDALHGWVLAGLGQRSGEPAQAAADGVRTACRLRRTGARAGLEWLLIRSVEIAVSVDDREIAEDLLAEIEDLHHLGPCRETMEILYLARGMVRADLVHAQVGAGLTSGRGNRPDLIQPWLVLARLADDPQPWLREAYEVAQQCESPLLREHIRAVSRDRGFSAPRAKASREALSSVERRIIDLISAGLTNRQIAAELLMSEKTVENHLTRLFARTGCRSRVQLAAANVEGRLVGAGTP